jgi:glucoamylase
MPWSMKVKRRGSLTICRKANIVVYSPALTLTYHLVLQTFWNEEEGYVSETTVTSVARGGRSGKGSVPLSVTVLNFDPSLGCDSATFQPCSDRALSSLKVLGDAFKEILPIADRLPLDQPSALLGAFYEEEIFGGHVSRQILYLNLFLALT